MKETIAKATSKAFGFNFTSALWGKRCLSAMFFSARVLINICLPLKVARLCRFYPKRYDALWMPVHICEPASSSQPKPQGTSMPKSKFVDFKAVKAAITMEQLLAHYKLTDQFKRSGESLSGPCPIHKGNNKTQFRINTTKNIWKCFSECENGGNTLDFIMKMENVAILTAANKAIEWFGLDLDEVTSEKQEEDEGEEDESLKPASRKPAPVAENSAPNKPLNFRLDKLVREHPYLEERGLELETLVDFGVGYCTKGTMAERIAIPIHNVQGQVLAYAGRYPHKRLPEDAPKYKLPAGFKKSLELFNLDRAIKEPSEHPLLIVEGFFDCMKLHQLGYRKVIALMGSTMSAAQEQLIREHTSQQSQVIVLLDENDAGRAGREDIAVRLTTHCFVKVHKFEQEEMEPEHLSADEASSIVEGLL